MKVGFKVLGMVEVVIFNKVKGHQMVKTKGSSMIGCQTLIIKLKVGIVG